MYIYKYINISISICINLLIKVHHLGRKKRPCYMSPRTNATAIAADYLQSIQQFFTFIGNTMAKHGRKNNLLWLSSPYYHVESLAMPPDSPYRAMSKFCYVDDLNKMGLDLAKTNGIPVLDIYALTKACTWTNCTVDGAHGSRFVNRMKAQLLLNKLCTTARSTALC